MNVYPSARSAFLSGAIDVLADTIAVRLLSSGYSYDSTDVYLADISGAVLLGTGVSLASKSVVSGALYAADVAYGTVTVGYIVAGILVYQDTGIAGTSRLMAHIDRKADAVPMALASNGGGFILSWPSGRVMRL